MQNIYQAKGATLAEQYLDVGKLFGVKIRQSVAQIAKGRAKATVIKRKVAEKAWQNLQDKEIAREFCECLEAWATGAKISPGEAMWLLADNLSGCQTAIVRYASGVALMHTEEEFIDSKHIETHMTDPYVIEFGQVEKSLSLVYNNLMPGCGLYGWKKDLLVAVDSLFLKEDRLLEVEKPVLANVVSWIIWRMPSDEVSPKNIEQLICELGELVDGYAINVVHRDGEQILGFKLTLARSENKVEKLGSRAGDYLRQTNLIDPKYQRMIWATPPKQIWRGGYRYFVNRYKTLDTHAKLYKPLASYKIDPDQTLWAHEQVQKTICIDLKDSYINKDVGAVCVGLLDISRTSVSCQRNLENIAKLDCFTIL